jgi:hypothetical protein
MAIRSPASCRYPPLLEAARQQLSANGSPEQKALIADWIW